ncbi:MAG: response regulator [Rickettsiales bacterium]
MSTNTLLEKHRPARVLLVEDNPGDAILTRRAFEKSKIANQLSVVTTGEQAVAMLRKEGDYANTEMPDIILLDLNLPQMSGQDVLKFIKDSPDFRHIPVIILSSSSAEQDVVKSYNLHANGYVVKPVKLETFSEIINKLEAFWFTLVVMPDFDDIKTTS